MSKFLTAMIFAMLVGGASAVQADTAALGLSRGVPADLTYVPEGGTALAPLAHIRFCLDNPRDCEGGELATLTVADLPVLSEVNSEVNRRIKPRRKGGVIGRWEVAPAAGDCNDYAVSKRRELLSRGLPAGALRLAVVQTRWGEGHLVLVVRTEVGDLVLDNLSSRVRAWTETRHAFVQIQSARDPNSWLAVDEVPAPRPHRSAPMLAASMDASEYQL